MPLFTGRGKEELVSDSTQSLRNQKLTLYSIYFINTLFWSCKPFAFINEWLNEWINKDLVFVLVAFVGNGAFLNN